MHPALRSLIFVLLVLFCLNLLPAKTEAEPVDVVVGFVIDVSASMFVTSPSHAAIQAQALQAFLLSYTETCVPVELKVLPWGESVGPVISTVLHSRTEAEKFQEQIIGPSLTERGATHHVQAFEAALKLFTQPDAVNILVFTTDEQGSMSVNLREKVPPYVTVYGISLGGRNVAGYLKAMVMPDETLHQHATDSAEFELVLDTVFREITNQFCLF